MCHGGGGVAQGADHLGQLGVAIIRLDLVDPLGVVDLNPEVVSVRDRSVVALVGVRDDDSQHLPLSAGQRRVAVHDGAIESH